MKPILSATPATRLPLFLLAALAAPLVPLSAESYVLEKHRIAWSGSMPAKTHSGLLTPKNLDISISADGTVESLYTEIDMDSIDVTDLEGKNRDKLMAHLRSEDFFFVEKHPAAEFTMDEHRDGALHGTLKIRGIAMPVSLPVEVRGHPDRGWILSGQFGLNRQDFDVNYQNSGFFGTAKDKLISDTINLDIEITVKPE